MTESDDKSFLLFILIIYCVSCELLSSFYTKIWIWMDYEMFTFVGYLLAVVLVNQVHHKSYTHRTYLFLIAFVLTTR